MDVEATADKRREEFVISITAEENNDDIVNITVSNATSIVKKRENIMSKMYYCALVKKSNPEQRELILEAIYRIHATERDPVQDILHGICRLWQNIHLQSHGYFQYILSATTHSIHNAYVSCASIGKAALAMGGTIVHSTFKIMISRREGVGLLSRETSQESR